MPHETDKINDSSFFKFLGFVGIGLGLVALAVALEYAAQAS